MIRYDEAKEFIKIGIINGYNYPLLKKKEIFEYFLNDTKKKFIWNESSNY